MNFKVGDIVRIDEEKMRNAYATESVINKYRGTLYEVTCVKVTCVKPNIVKPNIYEGILRPMNKRGEQIQRNLHYFKLDEFAIAVRKALKKGTNGTEDTAGA